MILSLCHLSFLFLLLMGILLMFYSMYFIMFDFSVFIEYELFNFNGSMVVMTLLFDWMSMIFSSFVMIISSLVIFYSYDYMFNELNIDRFVLLILLFVLSMVLMIVSPNLISILLGWDGLGLVSYCLVIYYQNYSSYNSGMLTVLSNRLGDVAILISISWMFNYGSWNYIYYSNFFSYSSDMNFIILLLMIASMTSSAQIPFSSWLPAAMAAPTPVSALVHSSTLVTAGVYLMIRFNFILLMSSFNLILMFFGSLTMLMSGLVANHEFDLSSIIALSTLSQLGFMMMILSLGFYELAFFHLLTHALFSALLFLCSGSFIHSMGDFQDIRFMGSLVNFMPLSSICFSISSLSLCGMPFLSGFYSSDLILDYVMFNWFNFLIFLICFFSIGLTSMYTFRLFYYLMIKPCNYNSLLILNDFHYFMNFGMIGLLLLTIFGGSSLMWLLFPIPSLIVLPFSMKLMISFFILFGVYVGYVLPFFYLFILNLFNGSILISSMGSMWFMPYLSTSLISSFPLNYGLLNFSLVDMGWNELFGAQGLYSFIVYMIDYFQNIFDFSYKIYMLFFVSWMFILFILVMI
uniref:NADH dehydrogenase subunit 5 n=1 Tax=China mantispoides TaxID=3034372 RepID=UPI00241167A1|nr:NADH dehydrogenase subunit 5 [China mantispoides]WEL32765.1 NADH dehydrogenase subunit 5 [China mantispoides]